MKETIEALRNIGGKLSALHDRDLSLLGRQIIGHANAIESAHAADQDTIARLMKLTDDEREAGRDRLLAAVRGGSHDDNPACDRCNGTGAEPMSDNVNYIPCRKCGAKRR